MLGLPESMGDHAPAADDVDHILTKGKQRDASGTNHYDHNP
jgi:hypothetical protein